jgi:hypothetical protein
MTPAAAAERSVSRQHQRLNFKFLRFAEHADQIARRVGEILVLVVVIATFSLLESNWIYFGLNTFFAIFAVY